MSRQDIKITDKKKMLLARGRFQVNNRRERMEINFWRFYRDTNTKVDVYHGFKMLSRRPREHPKIQVIVNKSKIFYQGLGI